MNFSVFCNHVLTPSAIGHILESEDAVADQAVKLDGFLGPSHVSSVIGSQPYEAAVAKYKKPVVIAGFEPLDVMQASLMLIRQINEGRCEVENEYNRVVTREGNLKAQNLVAETFELRDGFEWRGLGWMEKSALKIKPAFADWDAERRFELSDSKGKDVKGCACPEILRGLKKPLDCKLFGTICTPENPQGSCMVSQKDLARPIGPTGVFGAAMKVRRQRHEPDHKAFSKQAEHCFWSCGYDPRRRRSRHERSDRTVVSQTFAQ